MNIIVLMKVIKFSPTKPAQMNPICDCVFFPVLERAHIYQCIYIRLGQSMHPKCVQYQDETHTHSCFSWYQCNVFYWKCSHSQYDCCCYWKWHDTCKKCNLQNGLFYYESLYLFSKCLRINRCLAPHSVLTLWCEDGMAWWTNNANMFLQTLMFAWIISPFALAESWTSCKHS